MREATCPYCSISIRAPVLRVERPFACPQCGLIVQPRSRYAPLSGCGCVVVALFLIVLTTYLGLRNEETWAWVLGGLLVGATVGIVVGYLIRRALQYFLGKSTVLKKHTFREYPETMRSLADFLDEIQDGGVWLEQWEHKLILLETSNSMDEPLVNEGLMAANYLKSNLVGRPVNEMKDRSSELENLELEDLRKELSEIARDLRTGAQ